MNLNETLEKNCYSVKICDEFELVLACYLSITFYDIYSYYLLVIQFFTTS